MMKRSNIKNNEKRCESTKTKGFGCGKLTMYRKLGCCAECYPKWLYSTPEGQDAIRKQTIPLQKKRDDFKAAERDYEERKSLPALQNLTKTAVHAYIRERDKGMNCISCGCMWDASHQCGHFYPAGKYATIEYDEMNLANQCVQCNCRKDGNFIGYRAGYERRYGSEQLAKIDEKAALDKLKGVHKWNREDLIRIRKYFTAKLALIKPK